MSICNSSVPAKLSQKNSASRSPSHRAKQKNSASRSPSQSTKRLRAGLPCVVLALLLSECLRAARKRGWLQCMMPDPHFSAARAKTPKGIKLGCMLAALLLSAQPIATAAPPPKIIVEPKNWGKATPKDIRAVCTSAADTIARHLETPLPHAIFLRYSKQYGPRVLYKRGPQNQYNVLLSSRDNYWSQFAFQFAHEYGHIISSYSETPNPQAWLEESLAELASLFALRQMSKDWRQKAPYPNWKSYAPALHKYAENRIGSITRPTSPDAFIRWYQKHRQHLESTSTDRKKNLLIAVELLDIFEKTPKNWNALRYLNQGSELENQTLRGYLGAWWRHCPQQYKHVPEQFGKRFGIR